MYAVPPPDLVVREERPTRAPEVEFDLDGVPAEMVAEARERGLPVADWWLARSAGADIAQAEALAASAPNALLLGTVAAWAKVATWGDIVEATHEMPLPGYLLARDMGLSHDGAVLGATTDLAALEAASNRFGQAEVLEALRAGLAPADYAAFRRHAAHSEAMEAHAAMVTPRDYLLVASSGASHGEILGAVASGGDLWAYARRRTLGEAHSVAISGP